ncbi:MAG: rhodanese-like domain-containing protein [Actinomycetes bacterium]
MEQSASQFALAIADPAVVFLDVRTPDEFSAGHIERAINIDIYAQDFDAQVGALDRQSTYAVYCRSGVRSVTAMNRMTELGFNSFYHLTDGILGWISSDQPVVH